MTCIVAFGALSALGEGREAFRVAGLGEAPRVAVGRDAELVTADLARPFAARVALPEETPSSPSERSIRLVVAAARACAEDLDRVLPGWRSRRVGLCIGTSSGGLRSAASYFDELAAGAVDAKREKLCEFTYFRGMLAVVAELGLPPSRASLVLGACASSTLAIGLGSAWLDDDRCDLVLAGGYDAVGVFVAAGFEAIRATSKEGIMRPFCATRDGLVLGEGAALVALVREPRPGALGYVHGFGASSDAVHLTAPDRTGQGLSRAARAAIDAAGEGPAVGLVSAHATATDFNDAAESRAIAQALGIPRASDVVVHAFKPQVGHTLGAAGVLETLAALDALERGLLPATAGGGASSTDADLARTLGESVVGDAGRALKLSAAFGGANAALVLGRDPKRRAPGSLERPVFVSRAVHVTSEPTLDVLEGMTGVPRDKLSRTDRLSRFALGAVGALRDEQGPLDGAGIVVGHGLATHETNALFWASARRRGARLAEPRRFPFTSPNAPCGECSIAYRLTGPGFAVGLGAAGGLEALSAAADLVRHGLTDAVVVVAIDDVGPASARLVEGLSGAVALLVSADARGSGYARWGEGEVSVGHGTGDIDVPLRPAHEALVPLTAEMAPEVLEVGPSWGVFAKVRLRPMVP